MSLIIRANDVGHGNNKFTTDSSDQGFGLRLFPSIAPQSRRHKLSSGVFKGGNCFEVPVKEAIHIVGEDVNLEATTSTTHIVDPNFCLSNTYDALVKGALTVMRKPKIDLLVLGLPLTTYQTHAETLREKMVGGHTIFHPDRLTRPDAPQFMSVEVSAIRVYPQPVGAFFHYTIPRGLYITMVEQRNLILDVGLGTFDWFLADGQKPVKGRCNANEQGTLSIATAVATALGGDALSNYEMMVRIDKALRNRSCFTFNGKSIDLMKDFWTVAQNAIRESVASMMKGVGSFSDIDNIILTGGGAALFLPVLQASLEGREIILEDDPIYSVVKGLQIVGEKVARETLK